MASAVVHAALAATVGGVISLGPEDGTHEQSLSDMDVVVMEDDAFANAPSTQAVPASAPATPTPAPPPARAIAPAKQPRLKSAATSASPATSPLAAPPSRARFELSVGTLASTFAPARPPTAVATTAEQSRGRVTDASTEGAAVSEAEVDVPARLLATGPLIYPVAARQAEIEMDLPLQIVVDVTGRVVSARGLQRAGYGLDEAAVQGIRDYRFSPALHRGRPVPVRMRWTVQFSLR